MKREELKKIIDGITDEQLKAILDINGADVERARGDAEKVQADLKTAQEAISTMTTELEGLKTSKATAEDWEKKFNDLQTDIYEKEKRAKAEKAAAEKAEHIKSRYNAVCVTKDGKPLEFTHEAIRDSYFQKFSEALEDAANTGKSDSDIFYELTKDDGAAFKSVRAQVDLPGAKPLGGAPEPSSLLAALQEQYTK